MEAIKAALEKDLAGLAALRDGLDALDGALSEAIDLIAEMEGRLIVTGLGKSGHVAAKLAATFSSTGTPAYFLHPAEASHGDLGMVQSSDVILALSWSGETRELSDVIGYAKRHAVPLVAMTRASQSTLARASSIVILLPDVREACPHNLAPTTSTLVQMAMGDAVAIALLDRRGFSEASFHGFHPGGSLGASLKRIEEVMHPREALPLVARDVPIVGALSVLSESGFGIVGVTEGDALAGVITDGDVRRYLAANAEATMKSALHEATSASLMTKGSVTLQPDMIVGEALSILQTKRIGAAFVVDGAHPVGLVTMLRLLNSGAA